MNRAQRRSKQGRQIARDIELKRRNQMGMKVENAPMTMQHGHTDTHVAIKLSKSTDNIFMLPHEADAFIKAIQISQKMLAEHQARNRGQT